MSVERRTSPAVLKTAVPKQALRCLAPSSCRLRFLEFFGAKIQITRTPPCAYYPAARTFFGWIDQHWIGESAEKHGAGRGGQRSSKRGRTVRLRNEVARPAALHFRQVRCGGRERSTHAVVRIRRTDRCTEPVRRAGASPCADGSLRCRRRCRAGGGDGAARQPGNGCCVHRELVARNALCAFGLHCEPVLHAGSEKTKRD